MNLLDWVFYIFAGLVPLSIMAYYIGKTRARQTRGEEILHSRLDYYGWYSLVWLALPPMIIAVISTLLHTMNIYSVPVPMLVTTALLTAGGGLWLGLITIKPSLRARNAVERVIMYFLMAASLVSILTTVGIVVSILFEAIQFFRQVSLWEFLTGTKWSPEGAFLMSAGRGGEDAVKTQFGSVPIFAGTFMITAIAMLVAMPIGLLSAIYMSEYAPARTRKIAKPVLEILAGIPTVVYGFFAAITVSPMIVQFATFMGLNADSTNALAPGLVMGVMIIPLVSSLSDDVISAVPRSLREGSLALGMTMSETIKKVVLPAALPGIVSAFLLAISRALGETMIVVMAAGLRPNLTWNPLEGMTTVTVRIVSALTGDKSFDSLETLSAFALGLVLLLITLLLNVIATVIIYKFRQRYE